MPVQILTLNGCNDFILAPNAAVCVRVDNLIVYIRRDSYGGILCVDVQRPSDEPEREPYRSLAVAFPMTLDDVTERAANAILTGGKL